MSQPASSIRTSWMIALISTLAVLIGLYGFLPYCYGHGSIPVSLSRMLWTLWNGYEDWQHCMLVPFLVGWLVYRDIKANPRLEVEPSNLGLAGVVASLVLYWVGYKADIQYVGFVSAQALIGSLVLWFFGWKTFSRFIFPLAMLAFMWPFLFLDNLVAFPLRMVMAEISYRFLDLIGLDVVKQGSAVVSASNPELGLKQGERFAVDIADPCSGIRSLFALILITCLYGYLTLTKNWQRWILFLLAVPLAVLGNFFRILMLVAGTLLVSSDFAIGTIEKPSTFHMFAGFLVFGVALAGMVGAAFLLKRLDPNKNISK